MLYQYCYGLEGKLMIYLILYDLLGMTAPEAAGVIHSDFEKGFIRAETVSFIGEILILF